MVIQRPKYVSSLAAGIGNGLVKIVTGGRRCGKSFLLFTLFRQHLLEQGVTEDHIIGLSLDDMLWSAYRNPEKLLEYVLGNLHKDGKTHFVILDEVQLVDSFVEVMLSLMHQPHLEVYVSGSNSKFLSKDVVTEFRGRGQEIRVWPLTFEEYYSAVGGELRRAWRDYYTFGGLPQIALLESEEEKTNYLHSIYELTYLKDVIDRNHLRNAEGLQSLVRVLASSIGAPLNPKRISNTFASSEHINIDTKTIRGYITLLQDAFLIEEALRYDVKGRKYIGTETKYYFSDMGLRAIALNFRQQEEPHIMENIIYNELRQRGYLVDVGMVENWIKSAQGVSQCQQLEIDFVVNSGAKRLYIQSAYQLPSKEKMEQEKRSLQKLNDNFRKVIIVWDDIRQKTDDDGIVTLSLLDFLLDKDSIAKLL